MGIVNGEDFQIVYSDTPGFLKPQYKLQESMQKFSVGALADADVLLYVTDTIETPDKNNDFIEKVKKAKTPTIIVINKIDISDEEKLNTLVAQWQERIPEAEIFPASAKEHFGVGQILTRIIELLPECPPYFDKDQLTNRPMRFFATEIIREKILLEYDKEIPYSVEVVIESYHETPTLDRISALILVNRESQKGIIIGKGGKKLKKVGTEARKDLEDFLQKKVFLELFVKVEENWRDDETALTKFGYNPE